jgi:hypothetical protein
MNFMKGEIDQLRRLSMNFKLWPILALFMIAFAIGTVSCKSGPQSQSSNADLVGSEDKTRSSEDSNPDSSESNTGSSDESSSSDFGPDTGGQNQSYSSNHETDSGDDSTVAGPSRNKYDDGL